MSEIVRSRISRIGVSRETGESERNSKPRPSINKKNSWTNLATKARRLSKHRRASSSLSLSKTSKETTNIVEKAAPSYEKGLEDYTAWCNHYLVRGLHREISPDLRTAVGDGLTLVNLVECLTRKNVHGVYRHPVTWSQKLDNIHACFQLLNSQGIRTTGISPEDIIEGKLRSILRLFQCLETHFEFIMFNDHVTQQLPTPSHPSSGGSRTFNWRKSYLQLPMFHQDVRYPTEKNMDKNHSRSPLNGRISSGYHSEDDAYMNGRTTPTIEALPGLLAPSDTETDNESINDPSVLRLYHDGKGSSPVSETTCHPSRTQHSRAERSLDNIGYMPSHPSRKTRTSSKSKLDESRDRSKSSPESHNTRQHAAVSTSHVELQAADYAVFSTEDEIFHARDNYGLEFDFGFDDGASLDRGSVSSTGTPVLPDLSSASSFEDLPLDFSSDASGLQARDSFTTSSKLSQDSFNVGKYNSGDVQQQIDALHAMHEKLLTLMDKDSIDSRRKTKLSLPRMALLQGKGKNSNKKRTKDVKSLNRRFNRIESNIVTLARNIDHLRSEIRTQAETTQQLEELRVDVNEFKDSFYSGSSSRQQISKRSRDHEQRLRRLQKLKSFFGEEPPMVALLLQNMGYERFIPHFKAEEIGILELPYMTEQRLQNLGIPLGPRLRILEEIQNLR